MNRRCYIYGLTEPSGEVRYVGKAVNPSYRLKWHILWARRKQDSFKARWIFGLLRIEASPTLVILEIVHPWQDWQEREKFWITHYRQLLGKQLTNTAPGGLGGADPGRKFSDEALARVRKAQLESHLGTKAKEETKLKMSASHKGKKKSEDWRRKIGDSNRNPSQETRERMGEWQRGLVRGPQSEGARLKKSEASKRAWVGRRARMQSEAVV